TAITPPIYYIVPREWEAVIDVIKAHGLQFKLLSKPVEIDVESYKFEDVRWPTGPFEGRQMPLFTASTLHGSRWLAAGSLIIPVAQPLAKLAISLLEPEAPDSFVRWGFFNAVFEEKEYAEPYIIEQLAREMLATNSELKDEFESRLATDDEFAASSSARLEFFYRKSPYRDQLMNLYPVGRIHQSL